MVLRVGGAVRVAISVEVAALAVTLTHRDGMIDHSFHLIIKDDYDII